VSILSVQSSVATGHVGNAAAAFALQRLGAEVLRVDTVQFAHHPGRGPVRGAVTPPSLVAELLAGLEAVGALEDCDAVLSGYLGEAANGAALLETLARMRARRAVLLACDPVIGDGGRIYVRPGIPEWLRDQALPEADLAMPNLFELGWLTGVAMDTPAAIGAAARRLQARLRRDGPGIVLATSLPAEAGDAGTIGMLAMGREEAWGVWTPRLRVAAHGAGDLASALFLFHVRAGRGLRTALEATAAALHAVLTATRASGAPELALVAAQAALAGEARPFAARALAW
jgi:pyridoxine kinase